MAILAQLLLARMQSMARPNSLGMRYGAEEYQKSTIRYWLFNYSTSIPVYHIIKSSTRDIWAAYHIVKRFFVFVIHHVHTRLIMDGGEQGGKSPFSLLSEPISPSSLLFEPISPSSLNGYVSFSPSSLLFPPISPSSQLFLGHFSLLPILFLPPHDRL